MLLDRLLRFVVLILDRAMSEGTQSIELVLVLDSLKNHLHSEKHKLVMRVEIHRYENGGHDYTNLSRH